MVHTAGQLSLRAAPQLRHLQVKGGRWYQTCTLKWCTPRGNSASELHHSSGTFRKGVVGCVIRPAHSSGAPHGATQPQSCTTAQAPSGKVEASTRPAPSSGAPQGATQPQSCTTAQAPSGKEEASTRPAPSSGAPHGATQPQSCTTAQAPSGKEGRVRVPDLHPQVVHPTGQLSLGTAPQLGNLKVMGGGVVLDLHPQVVHSTGQLSLRAAPQLRLIHVQGGGGEYQTCTLKWCTPRGNSASELHHSSGTFSKGRGVVSSSGAPQATGQLTLRDAPQLRHLQVRGGGVWYQTCTLKRCTPTGQHSLRAAPVPDLRNHVVHPLSLRVASYSMAGHVQMNGVGV